MSEIAFWVFPCPSAYVIEDTLEHFFASSRAEAVVTRRQLLPPNPSVKPSEIFFGPHHDGLALVVADDDAVAIMATAKSATQKTSAPRVPRII